MKILIVEDEVHIARHLEKLVRRILRDTGPVIDRLSRFEDALAHLDNVDIDLLLLDLNLDGKDGFELLQLISAASFHTIIISAYKNRAIEAFEYGVLDFVPKPFSEKRLRKALSRIQSALSPPDYPSRYFAVRKKGKIHLIKDEEVAYFQAFGHYAKIHLKNGQTELHNKSLVKLMPILGSDYERVHKSYIVKMSEIENIHVYEGGKYEIELCNGAMVPLGRSKYPLVKEKWLR